MIYYNLNCEQINVIIAFLNSLLKKMIYVKQPKGYKKNKYDLICLLLRALYDLKQSSREWYFTLREFLKFKNFKHTEFDHFLFINEFIKFIINVYVNNIQIYNFKRFKHIEQFKQDLHKRFAMIDLDSFIYYLGMKI